MLLFVGCGKICTSPPVNFSYFVSFMIYGSLCMTDRTVTICNFDFSKKSIDVFDNLQMLLYILSQIVNIKIIWGIFFFFEEKIIWGILNSYFYATFQLDFRC